MKRYMLGVFYCSFLIAGNSVLLGAPDCPIIGRNKLAEFQAALAIADDITIDKKKKTLIRISRNDWRKHCKRN